MDLCGVGEALFYIFGLNNEGDLNISILELENLLWMDTFSCLGFKKINIFHHILEMIFLSPFKYSNVQLIPKI